MNCPHCGVHVDEHKASRCLDEWIAEKIFHYHRPPALRKEIPHYSTSIAVAWEVVIKNTTQSRRMELITDTKQNIAWIVGNKGEKEMGLYISAAAEKMSLAICRVAIKATKESE